MNLQNKIWFKDIGLPKYFCDIVLKHGLNKEILEGLTQGVEDNPTKKNLIEQKKTIRNSNISWLNDQWIYNEITPFIKDANISSNWNFDVETFQDCQFTIYKNTNFYDWHMDMTSKAHTHGPYVGKLRKLSMSILLNDPSEFEGGNLQFDYKENNNRITEFRFFKQGSCVVFPSFLWHRVTPVTRGVRYSLVIWVLGKPFK